jgi:hypothetical protein
MYEMKSVKSVDYYSLLFSERDEFESIEELNDYRMRMGVYYQKFIEQVSHGLSERKKARVRDWFEFNKEFIGFVKSSELVEGLEDILFG